MSTFYSADGRTIEEGTVRRAMKFYNILYKAKHGCSSGSPRPVRRLEADLSTKKYPAGLEIHGFVATPAVAATNTFGKIEGSVRH